jgi:thiamine biosynthesis lipoprotein
MGTRVYLAAYTPPGRTDTETEAAFDAAIGEMRQLEARLSEWRPDSDIGRVNQGAGHWVSISRDAVDVIERSLWAARLSDGAFDITFQAMHDLWKFGTDSEPVPRVPAPRDVAQRRALIDYRRVDLDAPGERVRIGAGQAIGLGGIAKGYIVDRAVATLRGAGLSSFIVQAGGDLFGAGRKADGSPWTSGIRDPRGPADAVFATLELTDHAFSTAGDYARAYVVDGRRYHHIIDPRSGYPAALARSVTVWAPDALTADAVDDAIFILGPERGLALARELPSVGVVMVDAANHVHVTENLKARLHVLRPPSEGP